MQISKKAGMLLIYLNGYVHENIWKYINPPQNWNAIKKQT